MRIYKALADRRGHEHERESQAAPTNYEANGQLYHLSKRHTSKRNAKSSSKAKGSTDQRRRRNGNDNDSSSGSNGDDAQKTRCNHCNLRNHTVNKCRKKAAGEPSWDEIKEAIAYLKEKKKGGGNGSINKVEGYGYISAPQAFLGHISADISANIPSSKSNTGDFLIDTGSTHHITSDRSLLGDVVKLDAPLPFSLPDTSNARVESSEKGDPQVSLATGQSVPLRDAHYIPAAQSNILSAGKLHEDGWIVDLWSERARSSSTLSTKASFPTSRSSPSIPHLQVSEPRRKGELTETETESARQRITQIVRGPGGAEHRPGGAATAFRGEI